MIETSENSVGEKRFELSIDVLLGINICETDTSAAVVIVIIRIMDSDDVVADSKMLAI